MNLWVVQTHTPSDTMPGRRTSRAILYDAWWSVFASMQAFFTFKQTQFPLFPQLGESFPDGPSSALLHWLSADGESRVFSILCMPSFLRLFLARKILKEKKNIFCDFLKWNSIKKRFWVVEKSFPELHCILLPLNLICAGFKHAKNVSSCKGCLLEMHFYERWLSMFRHNMTFLPWWLKKQFFEIEIMKMSLGMVCF